MKREISFEILIYLLDKFNLSAIGRVVQAVGNSKNGLQIVVNQLFLFDKYQKVF